MTKSLHFAVIVIAVATGAGTAQSAEPYLPRMQKAFERVDADKDGKVTVAELSPLAEKRFMRDDSNGDGQVSSAEIEAALKAAMERRRDRIMASMDANKDGSISKGELDAFVTAMVKGADTDQDGGVTMAEARSFRLAKWRKAMQNGTSN